MEWKKGEPYNYDYYPVGGDPKNGFYPVQKGKGTYAWNGEKIVAKEEIKKQPESCGK